MLSIVVNFFNNRREARNTLYSLSRGYQRGIEDLVYEVLAIDHGSSARLSESEVRRFGAEFQYRYVHTTSVSPVRAINEACRDAAGGRVMVIIDGAHILTPGVLRLTAEAFRLFAAPFVATVPFHLGPDQQNISIINGYCQQVEDRALEECRWRNDGYNLYYASGAFADDGGGWYGKLFETGCFAMRKSDYLAMGGYDERFQARGGGLSGLDFFRRALLRQDLQYVLLLGEGSFHQIHGGVATNAAVGQHPWHEFHDEYLQIRKAPFKRAARRPVLLGSIPEQARYIAKFSFDAADKIWGDASVATTPSAGDLQASSQSGSTGEL